ncbi:hypothetical protein [Nonomuraea dietziae]|uniref:hypothetical protein n=1 Tax=Nonomuraea dietziae TaxID=65515 RepID=UPI0031CFCE84
MLQSVPRRVGAEVDGDRRHDRAGSRTGTDDDQITRRAAYVLDDKRETGELLCCRWPGLES